MGAQVYLFFLCHFTLALLCVLISKPNQATEEHNKNKNNLVMENSDNLPKDVIKLLQDLNYWVSKGGDPSHPVASLKSTGESHSKFLDLKDKIIKTGYDVTWKKDKYLIIKREEKNR